MHRKRHQPPMAIARRLLSLRRRTWFALGLGLALAGCDGNHTGADHIRYEPNPPPHYQAEVVRTEYGIPHVTANDWGSLGYGYGYAFAQDNYCPLMREILFAEGRSAEFLGRDGDLESDFVYRWVNGDEAALQRDWLDSQRPRFRQLISGYAAGVNRYLSETGTDRLAAGPEGCRGAAWVRPVTPLDLVRFYRKQLLQAGIDNDIIKRGIADVAGPGKAADAAGLRRTAAGDGRRFRDFIDPAAGGSNALALGAEYTQSGRGLLLGNPHQPWQGVGRWHQLHLTIPGEYDAMGATLLGLPMVTIGFNKDLAWTHTVSYASHMTLHELPLNPDNPLQYRYDGGFRDIEQVVVSARELQDDGSLVEHSKTIYLTHYGPVVNLKRQSPLLDGWPMFSGSILAVRDANLDNTRSLNQWISMAQATSIAEFADATREASLPWVHTVAADRHGDVFYGDISVVPRLTAAQLQDCNNSVVTQTITSLSGRLIVAVDGSRSACEWGRSPDSPDGANTYGYSELPKLFNRSYVFNANNSHWLANVDTPLTGFPYLMGALGGEGQQQFLRTNLGHRQVAERMRASDGLGDTPGFNAENLQQLMFSSRVYAAEEALPDVLAICAAATGTTAAAVTEACRMLAGWDGQVDINSRGAHVFTELWRALASANSGLAGAYFITDGTFWREPFDPARPTETPSGIDTTRPANHDRVLAALTTATQRLADAGVALDADFGSVQFVERNQYTIPIHGGLDEMGTFSVIKVNLEEGGYRHVTGGNSYLQTVTWDDSPCPVAAGLVAHSQSTDPESPWYSDQTRLYSDKVWPRLPFCREDVERGQITPGLQLEN